MAKPKISWGFIGCGNVTELKSGPAYRKVSGFEVNAVMCRNIDHAKDYANRHNINTVYADADQLINDPTIDAIYIATPPDSHKYYALKVATAMKPCCVEKPLAPNYQECIEITSTFDSKDTPLFVAYYRRSLPRFNQVKNWIAEGLIGTVRHVSWHITRAPYQKDFLSAYNWRTNPTIAYGGYFDDLASHGLDLFGYLFGEYSQVNGTCTNQQNLYLAKDAIVGSWLHKTNITGSGYWNFAAHADEDKVNIYGSQGTITFSMFKNVALILTNGNGTTELTIDNPENIQLFHVQNIRDHLLGISEHPSIGLTASHTAWVMDKILGKI